MRNWIALLCHEAASLVFAAIQHSRGRGCATDPSKAGMAKLADAADLKSAGPKGLWGFDSPSRHQGFQCSCGLKNALSAKNQRFTHAQFSGCAQFCAYLREKHARWRLLLAYSSCISRGLHQRWHTV